MTTSPVYPHIKLTFFIPDVPPVILAAALGGALKKAGIGREEIDRILDDVVAGGPEGVAAACAKYVTMPPASEERSPDTAKPKKVDRDSRKRRTHGGSSGRLQGTDGDRT